MNQPGDWDISFILGLFLEELAEVSRKQTKEKKKKKKTICLFEIGSYYLALGCPETPDVDQANLRLVADLHASAS